MSNAKHLVVLIHGLNGYASDLEVLSTQLIVSGFEVYLPEQNQGKTSDGIAICARRLLDGVILRIKDVKATKISIVGYAIGGLFARYLIGLLFKTKIIPETLTPMNYICIDSPHLGSRADRLGFLGLLLDETQKDLMLNSRGDKDPVLLEMVNDLFLSSLQTFQTHTSYSPHELQNGFSSEGLVHNNQNSPQDLLKIEGIIIKRLNKINWKKITYIQRSISETNFWLSKPGILVTTDILERITENPLSHSNPTRRKSIKQQPIHMVVLIHGLDGFNTDMEFISQKLSDRYQIPIYTFCPECNHNQTHDGISNGAKRILEAVKKELITRNVKFISLVAHSLGGLYARCLVGLLFEEGVIPNRVIPLNFITLASPHLGSREHGKMVGDRLMSFMGSIIGLTGKELTLSDTTETGDPFLWDLANGAYFDGLKSFKRLSAYSNVKFDVPVHYSTAAIRKRSFCTTMNIDSLTLPAVINDDHPELLSGSDEENEKELSFEDRIFEKLDQLPWNRYAVIPTRPLLAHVDIIIKSEFWNHKHGFPVISHLIDRFRHHEIEENNEFSELKSIDSNEYLHLIVLIPGLDQVANDLLFLAETIRDKFPRPKYKIVIPSCNNYKTKDGIVASSQRLFEAIKSEVKGTKIHKISFISESSGGLLARYLIMLLFKYDLIPSVLEPMNFITISTPHLGIKKQAFSLFTKTPIEQEMILGDSNNQSILSLMTTDDFLLPLSLFNNLILYANTRLDGNGSYSACSISLEESPSLKFVEDIIPRIFKIDSNISTSTQSFTHINHPDSCSPTIGVNTPTTLTNSANVDPTKLNDSSLLNIFNSLNSLTWKRFAFVPEKQLIQPARFSYWNEKNPMSIHIMESIID